MHNQDKKKINLYSEIKPKIKTCILLLDVGISSVSEAEFTKFKIAASAFIMNEPDSTEFLIYGYHNVITLNTGEVNKARALDEVNKIVYGGGQSSLNSVLITVQNKINTLGNRQVNVVVFSNGPSSDAPQATINYLIMKGVSFICIALLNTNFSTTIKIFYPDSTPIHIYENCEKLLEFKNKIIKPSLELPFNYNFIFNSDELHSTNDDIPIKLELKPSCDQSLYKEKEIEIEILTNNFYGGQKVVINSIVDAQHQYSGDLILSKLSNASHKEFTPVIQFNIKVKSELYSGYFVIDLAWLCGEFITTENINVWVDGVMSSGKSCLLNMFFNLFTSKNDIHLKFYTSKGLSSHVTSKISFNDISSNIESCFRYQPKDKLHVYDKIKDNIKITLVDKPGVTGIDGSINYKTAAIGGYHDGVLINNIHQASNVNKKEYECHVVIFVITLGSGSKTPVPSEVEIIKKNIKEVIELNIQPILVVTHCDSFSDSELPAAKKKLLESFVNVEQENIFYLLPYINNETKRNVEKDLMAWRVFTRAIEIGKRTVIERDFNNNKTNVVGEDNSDEQLNGANIITSNPSNNKHFKFNVSYNSKSFKFKLPSTDSVALLYGLVKKKFLIQDDFSLLDQEDCELVGEYRLNQVFNNSETNLKVEIKSDLDE